MREQLNDGLRAVLAFGFTLLSGPLETLFQRRLKQYRHHQDILRNRYNVSSAVPIRAFGPEVSEALSHTPAELEAFTSGTLQNRKRIPYSQARLRRVRWAFIDAWTRMFRHFGIRRKSVFVLAPASDDGSLTSLLLREPRTPSIVACVQAPYRIQGHPTVRTAIGQYGDMAVKAWLLTVSNPGVMYATNPSTLAIFFEALKTHWDSFRSLTHSRALETLFPRIASIGARRRLERVLRSADPLGPQALFPGLEAVVTWDGGYVRPFLDRLRVQLEGMAVHVLPMFSMSTETVETLPACIRTPEGTPTLAFLPVAPGVLYEFLPEDALDDDVTRLLPPESLEPGKAYALVVSDAYGLGRYQTQDLFLCQGRIGSLPDLRFLRRTHLSFSFTGEKLTGEQVSLALQTLKQRHPDTFRDGFLTCFPAVSKDQLPNYKIVYVQGSETVSPDLQHTLCVEFDERLGEINSEYRSKQRTQRLGCSQFVAVSLDEFLRRAGAQGPQAQFKFLPLYPRHWERAE